MDVKSNYSLRLRCGRAVEEREVAVVQYMETALPNVVEAAEESSGCLNVNSYTTHKVDHGVYGKELKCGDLNVGEWYRVERFSSIMVA